MVFRHYSWIRLRLVKFSELDWPQRNGAISMDERDLALAVHALHQAFAIVESYEPDQRNPSRYMRQLRRVLRNPDLQAAVGRLSRNAVLGRLTDQR